MAITFKSLIASLLTCGLTIVAHAQQYTPRTVIAEPFPAITDPELVAAGQAQVRDEELVIGVELKGQARAYPINQLTGPRREIINDQLGGIAIAATW